MRSFRLVTILILLAFVGGPALLDRCLVSCHDEPSAQVAVPPCHEVQAHDGFSMAGVGACGHDHDGMQADRVSDLRQSGAFQSAHLAVVSVVSIVAPVEPLSRVHLRAGPTGPPAPVVLDLPLRL